ncbi:MAG: hypothetical protein ACI4UE_00865 [Candidatus Scatovivens sp.]
MKKFLIVLIFTIIIVTFCLVITKEKSFEKGGDTKIAYWNFNSNVFGKHKFSLSETMKNKDKLDGCIAPRM